MKHEHVLTVAGNSPVDLDALASQLRATIDGLPPGKPKLAAAPVASQSGVQEFLVVVRDQEPPHIHPDGDLVISVIEGGGFVQLTGGRVDARAGSFVVVPKGVCHAYHNEARGDSVLLATFSPINSKADCPAAASAGPDPNDETVPKAV